MNDIRGFYRLYESEGITAKPTVRLEIDAVATNGDISAKLGPLIIVGQHPPIRKLYGQYNEPVIVFTQDAPSPRAFLFPIDYYEGTVMFDYSDPENIKPVTMLGSHYTVYHDPSLDRVFRGRVNPWAAVFEITPF
jgi:hypothetical protein